MLVRGWRWGVKQSSAMNHTVATSRRSYSMLTVYKGIDLATTGLMSVLVSNDEIKEARLSMRKAGGVQEEYFVILLEGARVCAVNHDASADGSVLVEASGTRLRRAATDAHDASRASFLGEMGGVALFALAVDAAHEAAGRDVRGCHNDLRQLGQGLLFRRHTALQRHRSSECDDDTDEGEATGRGLEVADGEVHTSSEDEALAVGVRDRTDRVTDTVSVS